MSDIYTASNMVSLLTDANAKESSSNFYKLFTVFESEVRKIITTVELMRRYRGVDDAEGQTLDLIGENYNVNRAGMHDDIYRAHIKGAIARKWCDGSYNSVLQMLALTLNTDVANISLIEDCEGTATVSIDKVPEKELNAIGMSIEEYSAIVREILPSGIGLALRTYEGSFAFATNNPTGDEYTAEIDANIGFADDEQTTGGTLSGVIQNS